MSTPQEKLLQHFSCVSPVGCVSARVTHLRFFQQSNLIPIVPIQRSYLWQTLFELL
ncbi:hypothetical protein FDUTEX481_02242 [Tolypothrix sp. PCC 7601]|nr:hypothetical protein FDUTEX481_02242 [Tolypothrix sp. PCC 7601]